MDTAWIWKKNHCVLRELFLLHVFCVVKTTVFELGWILDDLHLSFTPSLSLSLSFALSFSLHVSLVVRSGVSREFELYCRPYDYYSASASCAKEQLEQLQQKGWWFSTDLKKILCLYLHTYPCLYPLSLDSMEGAPLPQESDIDAQSMIKSKKNVVKDVFPDLL